MRMGYLAMVTERTMRSRPYYYPYHMTKWRVRKIKNHWYIYRPFETLPLDDGHPSFPYGWKPHD